MMKAEVWRIGAKEPGKMSGPDIDVQVEGGMVEFVMTRDQPERPVVRIGVPVAQLAWYAIEDTEQLSKEGKPDA